VFARARPARNPPISIEKPIIGDATSAAIPNAQAILNKNKVSCEWASLFVIIGRTFWLKRITQLKITIALSVTSKKSKIDTSVPFEKPDNKINAIIATKSWTKRKPTEIFPYKLLRSLLSDNNFTIIIVLEKVRASAIYNAAIWENPSKIAIPNPKRVVNTICPIPVNIDTFPTDFSSENLSSKPSMNKSRVIPISARARNTS